MGRSLFAYPDVDWIKFSNRFIKSFGLKHNPVTTQIEPHDSLAEQYHLLCGVNSILIDFSNDIWLYISRGLLTQKKISAEVGSSTMPHKINPIHFENAEGNCGLANPLLIHLANKLTVSEAAKRSFRQYGYKKPRLCNGLLCDCTKQSD